jgi:hypothetical protein
MMPYSLFPFYGSKFNFWRIYSACFGLLCVLAQERRRDFSSIAQKRHTQAASCLFGVVLLAELQTQSCFLEQ